MDFVELLLIGPGLGALAYSLAYNQYHQKKENLMKVIVGIAIAICVLFTILGLFIISIGMLIGVIITHFILKDRRKVDKPKDKPKTVVIKKYINHCWHCKNQVNSDYDKLCFKCMRHYVCSSCGKCWCDAPDDIKYRNRY